MRLFKQLAPLATPVFSFLRVCQIPCLRRARAPGLLLAGAALLLAACGGGGGGSTTVSASTPTVSLSASSATVTVGQSVTLNWSSSNTSATCTASGAWTGALGASGTQAVTATGSGTLSFTITCGGVSNTVSVVASAQATPTVSMTLAPANVVTGQNSTLSWSSTGATSCSASGAWSGTQAVSGSVAVKQTTAGTYAYTLSCSGTGGSASGSASLGVAAGVVNTVAMLVDSGPSGVNNSINVPFVSVTVCRPGTTVCTTIDHVMVDTGSYGLRLQAPLLASLGLSAVTAPSGAAAYECAQFIDGYVWGPVQQADVKLAGETASAIPIHAIGASSGPAVPTACSNTGANLGSVAALGANGVLGIGLFAQDCGTLCANSAVAANYYSCSGSACVASAMPLAKQVSNPVASFAVDNNGVLLVFPAVAQGGASTLSGTLVFGIGTQSNNQIQTEAIYTANSVGNFTTVYKGTSMTSSFIDSGSNGLFFNDSTITGCTQSPGFYCPAARLNLSATNYSADGSRSTAVNFAIESVDALPLSVTAASVGGTSGSTQAASRSFDWGLPFFFGRRVFVGIEASGVTPYWAY